MKRLKRFSQLIFILFFILSACVFYAFKVEPYRVKTKEVSLHSKSANVIKIAQFSDTHIKEDFTVANLDKVIEAINKQEPDLVVFTGDLYDNYAHYNDDHRLIAALQSIQAKQAKLAIWGNRDYGGGAVRQYKTLMEEADFTLLTNSNYSLVTDSQKTLFFTGLDDSLLGHPSLPDISQLDKADFRILLTHEPDTAKNFTSYPYDLVLSGHSHGGQINVPFIPAINQTILSSTSLASTYVAGLYELTSQTSLYVNQGIGTTHISARFGVVPEVTVFTIYL